MIVSITFCLRHSGRVNNRKKIFFKPGLNVIIGPNGSGKSSLLSAVYECQDCRVSYDKKTDCRYFNSETMNPHRSGTRFRGIDGSLIKVRALFSSHGETMRDVLRLTPIKPGDCFLLDEPEAGHGIEWVIRIRKGLDMLVNNGCQIIAASHHPVFWKDSNVIELKRGYQDRSLRKFQKSLKISDVIPD